MNNFWYDSCYLRSRFIYLILILTKLLVDQIHHSLNVLGVHEISAQDVVSWTSGSGHRNLVFVKWIALCVILHCGVVFLDSVSVILDGILSVDVKRRMLSFISSQVKVRFMAWNFNLRLLFPLVQVKICTPWVVYLFFFKALIKLLLDKRIFTQKVLFII